jgi:hypothetical protein
MIEAVVGFAAICVMGWLAYGSWPWEREKTWRWIRPELEHLRAEQKNRITHV